MASTSLQINDMTALQSELAKLQSVEDPTNWVLLTYQTKEAVSASASGSGGLEEFKRHLVPSQVLFGVLEFVVGDSHEHDVSTRKFVLASWIGPDVPSGMQKARSAGHRSDLRAILHEHVAIAAEIQAEALDDLTLDAFAQAVSRMRGAYKKAVDATPAHKAQASGRGGTSRFEVVDEPSAVAALESVSKGANDYCILATVAGSRGQYELISAGSGGVAALKGLWPSDRVFFALTKIQQVTEDNQTFQKYVLISLVGEGVSPLARARTAGQSKEVADWLIAYVPFHGLYQPNDPSDLEDSEILKKFK